MLSVDPGTKAMGWSNWRGDRLESCGVARGKDWITTVLDMPRLKVERLVIEDQQIYRGSGIDAHALLAVARVVGGVVLLYGAPATLLVRPSIWKGQLPKAVCHRRTMGKLTEDEQAVLGKTKYSKAIKHNMLDAIGIGLWNLGRR